MLPAGGHRKENKSGGWKSFMKEMESDSGLRPGRISVVRWARGEAHE